MKKIRKPRDCHGCSVDEDGFIVGGTIELSPPNRDGSKWVMSLKRAKNIHKFLTKAIAYLESK